MSRPPLTPRLSQIEPRQLGEELSRLALSHATRLASAIGYSLVEAGPSDLACTVTDLARYALGDCGLDAPVDDYLASLLPLWSAPLGHAPTPFELAGGADPSESIGVVMAAALAREAIGAGRPVSAERLAVLAEVDAQHVRLLARRGELRLENGEIQADEARRWLAGRGVAIEAPQ